ncbi:MAG: OmpA family protein, partial [Eggerthellaceae bacterium]|nr:OmpA family protein [Eggerthellaceae bacterium]
GYGYRIQSVVFPGDGYDTGDTVLETEHSCEIRLEFNDNVLSSITVGDAVYLNAGLQDNIARDDLDELEPSVYREATVKRDEILDELKKAFAQAGIDAAVNEKTGEVVMDNSVLFATDSYELGDAGKEYLDRVFAAYASVILDEKYSAALKEVSFEGNTDSDGESEYNMRLSENRANAVMSYCSGVLDDGQRSVFDGLAVCRGYGESDLVYDENGYENKDASRRVAIKFFLEVN